MLKTSKDYYEALRWSRKLADNITEMIDTPGTNVFAYSIFYVFYEQYLTMFEDTLTSLGISLGAVFIVTFVLSGFDLKTSIVTILIIVMILIDLGKCI